MFIQRICPFILGLSQHRIEQGDLISMVSQVARGIECTQRGIGLHGFPQFRVEAQEIRLTEKDLGHIVFVTATPIRSFARAVASCKRTAKAVTTFSPCLSM